MIIPSNDQSPLSTALIKQKQFKNYQAANDIQNNPVSKWVRTYGEDYFKVLMWYPNERILIPVQSLQLAEINCRLLEVKYLIPKPVNDQLKFQRMKDYFTYDYTSKEEYLNLMDYQTMFDKTVQELMEWYLGDTNLRKDKKLRQKVSDSLNLTFDGDEKGS